MLLIINKNIRWLFCHFILNIVLLSVLGLPYLSWMTPPEKDVLARLYIAATQVGWFGIFALFIALPLMFLSWLPHSVIKFSATLFTWAACVLLVIDVEVYQQYRFHLSGFIWELLWSGNGEVISLSWYTLSVASAIIAGLGQLSYLTLRLANLLSHRSVWPLAAGFTVWFSALLFSQGIHAWKDAQYDAVIPSYSYHWPLYYPLTSKSFFYTHGIVEPQEARQQSLDLKQPVHSTLNYPLSALVTAPDTGKRPNILILAIDAWRFDDATRAVTPNILKFAKDSYRFQNHLSGGNSTQVGIFSLFYGLPATYWDVFQSTQTRPVMMQTLDDQNYQFSVFSSAMLNSPPFDRTVFRGIPGLRTQTSAENVTDRDEMITQDFLSFLSTRDLSRPFFGFLFYDSAHAYTFPEDMNTPFEPYWDRVDHIKLNNDFDTVPFHNRYRNALHFVDRLIARVLNQLQSSGELDNTIVIIMSDHGEEFNDHHLNYWGHGSNYSKTQIHVPMFVHIPHEQGQDIDWRTTYLDVVPTVMRRFLGITNPFRDYAMGNDMFTPQRGHEWLLIGSYFNYAMVSDQEILVTYPSGNLERQTPELKPSGQQYFTSKDLRQALEEMKHFLQ